MSSSKPVLVYQMGKVASSTVTASLKAWGVENIHVHYLTKGKVDQIATAAIARGEPCPSHITRARQVVNDNMLSNPLNVVSLVRDPVARNISAFFQHIGIYFPGVDASNIDEQDAIDKFFNEYSHDVSVSWFEEEFNRGLGIDIFDCSFDQGSSMIAEISNYSILILKVESTQSEKEQKLSEFLSISPEKKVSLSNQNVAKEKPYAQLYSRFLSEIKIPKDYLDRMYDCRQTRFFYSEDEISGMRNRWRQR